MNKTKSEKNLDFKYHLLQQNDDEDTLNTSIASSSKKEPQDKGKYLKHIQSSQCKKTKEKKLKSKQNNYDTNVSSSDEFTKQNSKKEATVINPLFNIDEYLSVDKKNANNNNNTKSANTFRKQDNHTHKRNSFLNILTRTIKNLVSRNQEHLDKNNFIDKKTYSFKPKQSLANKNRDFLIDDIEMSLHENDKVQLKLLMPRNCFENTNFELSNLNTRKKGANNVLRSTSSKSVQNLGCESGGVEGRYVISTSSDTDINKNQKTRFNMAAKSSSSNMKKSKIQLNNRLFSKRADRSNKNSIIRLNKSDSLIKLNACDFDVSSLNNSGSDYDFMDGQRSNLKRKGNKELAKRKCLIFLCFVSFLLNPLFGKIKIL